MLPLEVLYCKAEENDTETEDEQEKSCSIRFVDAFYSEYGIWRETVDLADSDCSIVRPSRVVLKHSEQNVKFRQ